MLTLNTTIHNPAKMNIYESANGEQICVCRTEAEIEMPLTNGGAMVKFKRLPRRDVTLKPAKALPIAMTDPRVPEVLPKSTFAPVTSEPKGFVLAATQK